jgi:hypothetical protein
MTLTHVVGVALLVLAFTLGAPDTTLAQQATTDQENAEQMLTYSRGQAVLPAYHGWTPKPDGTIDLWFGYLNQNFSEELDIPVGSNNFVSGRYGPDAGQPTHFLPRNNRWIFRVTVPKDFPEKELVWTLISHGKTYRAYATLHPGYIKDDSGLQREYFGEPPPEGNKAPEIRVEGEPARTLRVGEAATLRVIATDDGIPRRFAGIPGGGANLRLRRPSVCGANANPFYCGEPNEGAGALFSVRGLRMACFLYRGGSEVQTRGDKGQAALVSFDPPQEKVWEDHRRGSPWATGYTLPPIPKDNTWLIQTSFKELGTYVVRCQAHDGLLVTNQDVTFTVAR